ncbi:trimethylamine methyltransferase family protein [Desulfobacterales bacterium HSG2]|nr:trimethylamine methyltransferase family protein [Desulfobacterales bacterium HSG2]
MNQEQVEKSKSLLGEDTVNMLSRVHEDALWLLENTGVGCKHPEILQAFEKFEDEGLAIIYENRIYITADLVNHCLKTAPEIADFFVARNTLFVGDTASHVYNDVAGKGGLSPSAGHLIRIAKTVEKSSVAAGMGGGIKLRDEVFQMKLIAEHCNKPLYFKALSDAAYERAKELSEKRKNIMIVSSLTSSLEVNENNSEHFVKIVQAGLPVFVSANALAGISAPYCYSGVLTMTHADALFGICAAQLINPGITCIHAGYPTIADSRIDYNPNYGLISHNLANILMAHLNLMLDIPACQSGGATQEADMTDQALADTRTGLAMCLKYGVHTIRHSLGFLRDFNDFSFAKLEASLRIAEEVTPADAPEVEMPVYDERGMESIKRIGMGTYKDDDLTTVNMGKVFAS